MFGNMDYPVHVVRYEDLLKDHVGEVEKILNFLHFSYTHEDMVAKLNEEYTELKALHIHLADVYSYFSVEQKEILKSTLFEVMNLADFKGKSYLFHFKEYLEEILALDQGQRPAINTAAHPLFKKQRSSKEALENLPDQSNECKQANCLDYLSMEEKILLESCRQKTIQKNYTLQTPTCRFLKGYGRDPVALNSQEGSGNTWLRGLLEKATGICTGFYGCDYAMRAEGFLGESIKSGHVLVVKTHVHIPKWKGERSDPKLNYESAYGSGVFLIRNPARGMIAEWNRLTTHSSHTNVASENRFGMLLNNVGSHA